MGYYINQVNGKIAPAKQKAKFLIEEGDAKIVDQNSLTFQKDLVCVVENGPFDAAAYIFSENEMRDFNYPDGRNKTWLIVPNAANLAGYEERVTY
jgi:hypothetical protein